MKRIFAPLLVLSMLFFYSCQKETSLEENSSPATGTLQDDVSGDCAPMTVIGTYVQGTALIPTSNQIQVEVQVTGAGSYTIYSDTVNGVYFRNTGIFTSLGANTVTLRGNGTPFAQGTFNFVITFQGQSCTVPVTFLPTGAGGPAAFTIVSSGTPASCSGATPTGTYVTGIALNSTNKVTLQVNVTTIGTYNISTTATNGMTFAGSGSFTTTGPQTVQLSGSGTPTAGGAITIPVTAGASTCNFVVNVTAPAALTVNCALTAVNGTYTAGTPLGAGNTITVNVNVTAAGAFAIATPVVNGMTFAWSGNLTVGTNQTITLTGTGTPTAAGTNTINIPVGATTCNATVTVAPGTAPPTSTFFWKFNQGSTLYQGSFLTADVTLAPVDLGPPVGIANLLDATGYTVTGDTVFTLGILDLNALTAGDTYPSTASATGASAVYLDNDVTGAVIFEADPNIPAVTTTVTITSHNTTTKTIEGTFSGTIRNASGLSVPITNGQFKVQYQ